MNEHINEGDSCSKQSGYKVTTKSNLRGYSVPIYQHNQFSRRQILAQVSIATMQLPTELICEVIQNVVNEEAVFVFDVEIGETPHPPLLPRSSHIRFRPVVNPRGYQGQLGVPGKYESLVSKTIRSLLLVSKSVRSECLRHLQGIAVPTVHRHAVVRFNPRVHVICLDKVIYTAHQVHWDITRPGPQLESWARHDSDLLTELDFEIDHLAFMGSGLNYNLSTLRLFQTAFPNIQHLYGAFVERPRNNPSEHIGVALPAHGRANAIHKVVWYMARKHCQVIRRSLSSPRRISDQEEDEAPVPPFEELVII